MMLYQLDIQGPARQAGINEVSIIIAFYVV